MKAFDLDQALRDGGGVLARRRHPELAGALDWQLRCRRLVRVLPGVYARPKVADSLDIRLLAVAAWQPDAVLVGAIAAKLTFWPSLEVRVIEAANVAEAIRRGGYAISARRIPVDLVHQGRGFRCTDPALTALDLCDTHGGDGIDAALRSRAATLLGMRAALAACPGRPGNRRRRELLLDSRDEPWSPAERLFHRMLRAAGITGWRANYPVVIEGARYYPDVAFPTERVLVEIDGREHHGPENFERDRWRQNALVLAGWCVLRFTWHMLIAEPDEVISDLRTALRR